MENKDEELLKEFKLTKASVKNRKTVFLIAFILVLGGLISYNNMPKEYFPELVIPEIYVGTPFPGGSPEFIKENITKEFEEEIKQIVGSFVKTEVDRLEKKVDNGFAEVKSAIEDLN